MAKTRGARPAGSPPALGDLYHLLVDSPWPRLLGIIATLLAGTVQGLSSYVTTMKTTDSKLNELQKAEAMRASVAKLVALPASDARPRFGSARGLIRMSEDFDAPLEDLKDCRAR